MALSMIISDPKITGEQYTHRRNPKRLKSYMISGKYNTCNGDYIFHICEYDTLKTPKGDRYFDIVLSAEQFDAYLQILKLQEK